MKNFKAWLFESESYIDDKTVSYSDCFGIIRDAIKLRDSGISASSLIDARIGMDTKPFFYLEDINKVFLGNFGSYHRSIIDNLRIRNSEDENLRNELARLYYGLSGANSPMGVVGRIAYGINYNNINIYIPRDLRVDLERKNMQELKDKMRGMDIIAFYKSKSGSKTDENVKKCLKKLEQDGHVRNKDKTIVINENKVTIFDSLEDDYKSPENEKEEIKLTMQQSKEKSRRFIPKPQTMRQAAYQAGIPMGDWNTNL
jgi:hypothetical protein